MAKYPKFNDLVKLQRKNENNATREELVLKFFAYLHGRADFKGAVKEFLNDYMKANKDSFDVEAERARFHRVADGLARVIDGPLLRINTSVTPQNELEAVLVAAAEVIDENGQLGDPPPGWLDDLDLVESSTGATNTRKKLDDRIVIARTLLTP